MAAPIAWLCHWWRGRAREVRRQYRAMLATAPAAMADLKLYCMADDSTHVAGSAHDSAYQAGRRDAWLHIQNTAGLTDADLADIDEEIEHERSRARADARNAAQSDAARDPWGNGFPPD